MTYSKVGKVQMLPALKSRGRDVEGGSVAVLAEVGIKSKERASGLARVCFITPFLTHSPVTSIICYKAFSCSQFLIPIASNSACYSFVSLLAFHCEVVPRLHCVGSHTMARSTGAAEAGVSSPVSFTYPATTCHFYGPSLTRLRDAEIIHKTQSTSASTLTRTSLPSEKRTGQRCRHTQLRFPYSSRGWSA